MKAFSAMVKARTMEFVRDKGTFYWNLLFPVVIILGLAFAFSGTNPNLFKVGVIGGTDTSLAFFQTPQTQFIPYQSQDLDQILGKLRGHKLDAVVDTAKKTYWINELGKNAPLVQLLIQSQAGGQNYTKQTVTGAPVRYVDWLVPGVIAMNLMFSCLFGVGFVLVRYRKNGVLKRMKATPVSALSFVTAQGVSRFLIVLLTSIVIFAATDIVLKFRMEGSYLLLILLFCLGILSMISLGLVFASRFKSEELANGLMNLVTFPMMLLSGVFFSLEGAPKLLQTSTQILPLTHLIQGARAIMLDGAGFWTVAPDMLFLGAFTVLCLGVAAWLFKWE